MSATTTNQSTTTISLLYTILKRHLYKLLKFIVVIYSLYLSQQPVTFNNIFVSYITVDCITSINTLLQI